MRTQDEAVARFKELVADNRRGLDWRPEVLASYVDYDHAAAADLVKEGVTRAEWDEHVHPLDEATVRADATSYLLFAWGKALDHRGISASRSVDKLEAYLWLLDAPELPDYLAAEYQNYGAPKLRVACAALGAPMPTPGGDGADGRKWDQADSDAADRMADGLPCVPDCTEGCS